MTFTRHVLLFGLIAAVAWTTGCGGDDEPTGESGGFGASSGSGGSSTGGSNTGGSNPGNTGGSNTGGSNTGGSNTGGSTTGGTGGGVPVCNYQSCPDGCCDGSNCITPTTNAQCGSRGTACQPCGPNLTCVSGQCVSQGCSNCPGCCLNDQCYEGNSPDACGLNNAECRACGSNESCSGGACVPNECNATTCPTGCCTANGECLAYGQQTPEACGRDGGSCSTCVSGATCEVGTCVLDQPCNDYCIDGCCNALGQCIPFSDQDPDACGWGGDLCEVCQDTLSCYQGECVPDPTWRLWIVSAILPELRPDGSERDSTIFQDPLPDGFVGVTLANGILVDEFTDTIANTITPRWDEPMDAYSETDLLSYGLDFEFRESDGVGIVQVPFERMEFCHKEITADMLTGEDYTFATCGATVTQLTIRFVQE